MLCLCGEQHNQKKLVCAQELSRQEQKNVSETTYYINAFLQLARPTMEKTVCKKRRASMPREIKYKRIKDGLESKGFAHNFHWMGNSATSLCWAWLGHSEDIASVRTDPRSRCHLQAVICKNMSEGGFLWAKLRAKQTQARSHTSLNTWFRIWGLMGVKYIQ